jgi:hypothetical protein
LSSVSERSISDNYIKISSDKDISALKAVALMQRGEKKVFLKSLVYFEDAEKV